MKVEVKPEKEIESGINKELIKQAKENKEQIKNANQIVTKDE